MTENLTKFTKTITTITAKSNKSSVEKTLSNAQEFDDILEVVGPFGRYQKWLLFLIFMPVSFFVAFTVSRPPHTNAAPLYIYVLPCLGHSRLYSLHVSSVYKILNIPN